MKDLLEQQKAVLDRVRHILRGLDRRQTEIEVKPDRRVKERRKPIVFSSELAAVPLGSYAS